LLGLPFTLTSLCMSIRSAAAIVRNVPPQEKSYKLLGAPAALRRCSGALTRNWIGSREPWV